MPDRAGLVLLARRLAIVAVLAVALAPVVWLFSIAYKPTSDIFASPPQLLFSPTWDNFASVFRYFNLWALLESSLIIAIGSTVLSLIIGVPAGYALARATSPRAIWLAYFFLIIRTVPPIATLIPFYLLMRDIGLLGTWWAVIMLNTALNSAFVVWMMFSYFRAAPASIEEAALTDGCTDLGAFLSIALADRGARPDRERHLLRDVLLERFPLRDVPDQGRHQDDLGRPSLRLRHEGHFVGNARRARPFLDAADRAHDDPAQSLFRAGFDPGRPLIVGSERPWPQ